MQETTPPHPGGGPPNEQIALTTLGSQSALPPGGAAAEEGAAEVGHGGDTVLDPQTTCLRNLFCAWSIGLLTAVEGTVSVPSLWKYVQSLGGSKHFYGLCISAFAVGRFSCMGIFGMWADRRPYKEVFGMSLLVSMLAGLIYSAAPALGLWCIVAGRGLLGAMSAQSVATQAFVSRNTSLADRTRYMGIFVLVSQTLQLAGPAFNLIIVSLPRFVIDIGPYTWVFDNFTWVGYFLFVGQLGVLTFILCCFREPPRQRRPRPQPIGRLASALTLGGVVPWMRVWVDPWLHKTGAWFIFLTNFRNNYSSNALSYAIPLITDHDYGWSQLENSYIFLALSMESILSTCILSRLSKWVNDRNLIAIWSAISHSGFIMYAACSVLGTRALPSFLFISFLVWIDFGTCMPPTQSLYSKLIGKGNAGLYFSVLQSNGSISNVAAGQLVGSAYGGLGPAWLWLSVQAVCWISWGSMYRLWGRLHPEYIATMHARLNAPTHETSLVEARGEHRSVAEHT